MMQLPINHLSTAMPLYVQIAEGLLDQIESGELPPGSRLPSERELSARLGVNRMTLRQALDVVSRQGLLDRRQGDGTYISEPKIERDANRLVPFTKGMRRQGYTTGAQVIMLEQRLASISVAAHLKLPVSTPVYYGHRLRCLNQIPVMLEKFALPVSRFPNLETQDLNHRSLYEVMEVEYGIVINRARQSLEAVPATAYEAEWLAVEPGAPLMLEERVGLDATSQPVEYAKDLYRGDRFRFVTELAALAL
jgi:GntR family transcriptional regulator